jgi:hypothetical protein
LKGPVLFLAGDGGGRLRLIAALSETGPGAFGLEGGRARLELVPELAGVAQGDPRGRRVDLARLLAPQALAIEPGERLPLGLADLAAHLIELPALGTPAADGQRHPVQLCLLDGDAPELQPLWPVPGGFLEIEWRRFDPARAGFERAALWTRSGAPGGPSLKLIGTPSPSHGALLALAAEAELAGLSGAPNSFLAEWLQRGRETGGAALEATRAYAARQGLRALLRRLLVEGGSASGELSLPEGRRPVRLALEPKAGHSALSIELDLPEGPARLQLALTGALPGALAPLAGPGDELVSHRLLLWRARGERGPALESCVDVRTFLLGHPETWSAPRALAAAMPPLNAP